VHGKTIMPPADGSLTRKNRWCSCLANASAEAKALLLFWPLNYGLTGYSCAHVLFPISSRIVTNHNPKTDRYRTRCVDHRTDRRRTSE